VNDPYRNAGHDVEEAKEHMEESYGRRVAYDEKRTEMSVDDILRWDDYGSWGQWEPGELLGLSPTGLRVELTKFRGPAWAQRALVWLKEWEGIPAIVLASTRDAKGIADGRGRVSLAVGFGIARLPVVVLRERRGAQCR